MQSRPTSDRHSGTFAAGAARLIIDAFIHRLERFAVLSPEEKAAVRSACSNTRSLPPRFELLRQGESTTGTNLILSGFACRYTMLPGGRRQITAYLIPGDLCDVRACMLDGMDHSIGTLSPVEVAQLSHDSTLELTQRVPGLTRAVWWSTLVEEATTREWVLNVGHRTALSRTAHLFCELFSRMHAVDLTHQNMCALPITQSDLADALALSPVHVNRTLMKLRALKLATFRHQHLTIHDFKGLQDVGGFDPAYLRLEDPSPFSGVRRPGTSPPPRPDHAETPVL